MRETMALSQQNNYPVRIDVRNIIVQDILIMNDNVKVVQFMYLLSFMGNDIF